MCLSGDYRVTWDPRINTRMDKQGEVCKGEAVPGPSLGTCSISLTRNLPAVFPLSPPIESLLSILCYLPGPPAQISFPDPGGEWELLLEPGLMSLLMITEHLL